ncbi:MAG: hypothetical protein RLZZ630_1003 [Bacteroidota bacterium]|jgi:hypothetical protein
MEFKTIVYIIIGVFWLLSRFFQKVKLERESGQSEPLPERNVSPERSMPPMQPKKRGSQSDKKKAPSGRESLPADISLENPAVHFNSPLVQRPTLPPSGSGENAVIGSDAERISDEIRNGQFDWSRAVIISELINRKSGF